MAVNDKCRMTVSPMARLDRGQGREEEKEEEMERQREKEREKGWRAGQQAALAKAQPMAAARPPLGELAASGANAGTEDVGDCSVC